MHVSDLHKYVYFSVPHTKSTSTRRWLQRYYDARQVGLPHDTCTPESRAGYFAWTIVREPHERAASLWKKIHRTRDRVCVDEWLSKIRHPFPQDFYEFVTLLSTGDMNDFPFHQFRPQSEFLRGVHLDMTFKFDSVPDQLTKLPFALNEIGLFQHQAQNTIMSDVTTDSLFRSCPADAADKVTEMWAPEDEELHWRAI